VLTCEVFKLARFRDVCGCCLYYFFESYNDKIQIIKRVYYLYHNWRNCSGQHVSV
jgi:hypothetical protein